MNPPKSVEYLRLLHATEGRDRSPEEQETLRRLAPPRPERPLVRRPPRPYEGSVAMLPVAQLYARDVPDFRGPEGTNLLQVLWCPFDDSENAPKVKLVWRASDTVTNVLADPPEPVEVQYDGYLPEPCLLHPEQITEYPSPAELSKDLQALVKQRSTWERAGVVLDDYEDAARSFYWDTSVAPGWKVGGWTRWGLTDPFPLPCPTCGIEMDPFMTIDSDDWDGDHDWIPYEDQSLIARDKARQQNAPHVQIGRGYRLQIYVCPVSWDHPNVRVMP